MTRYTSFPRLPRFNRECEFTVQREIKINGVVFTPGSPLDKTHLSTRRLRQLFDQRFIGQGAVPLKGPELPSEIDFAQLPTAAIIDWLKQRQKSPRPNSDRAKIINLAKVVQAKEKEAAQKEVADGIVPGNSTEERDPRGVQKPAPKGNAKKADSKRNRELAG